MGNYMFDLLNRAKTMTDEEKVSALRKYLHKIILDAYTDDEGTIYESVSNIVCDENNIDNLSLTELDNIVDREFYTTDLMTVLLTFVESAKCHWDAKSATLSQSSGIVVLDIKFDSAEMKEIFCVEMDEDGSN